MKEDLDGTIGVVTICADVDAGDTGSATGGEAGEAGGLGEQLGESRPLFGRF